MIDSSATASALRNRLLSLDTTKVATTGPISLAATATGYTRASGSFLADGFADGMEFSASGFATSGNNGVRVISSVSALSLTTTTATTVEASSTGRTLSVGLPVGRAFENKTYAPISGRPYIEEDFVPATHSLLSFPAQGGTAEETGLYVIKVYGLEGTGGGGIRKIVDAIKRLFTPGTVVTAAGVAVRVRGDVSVTSGQILPQGDGWAVCTVTIPWRAYTQNTIAA